MKSHFGCPVQATSNDLAGKWKVLIVWHLSFGSRRFAEIRDLLPGVSEKVLTAQLRELQRDQVIRRLATEDVPPRVDYMLGDAGKELIPVMEAMCGWGPNTLAFRRAFLGSCQHKSSSPRQYLLPKTTLIRQKPLRAEAPSGFWADRTSRSGQRVLKQYRWWALFVQYECMFVPRDEPHNRLRLA